MQVALWKRNESFSQQHIRETKKFFSSGGALKTRKSLLHGGCAFIRAASQNLDTLGIYLSAPMTKAEFEFQHQETHNFTKQHLHFCTLNPEHILWDYLPGNALHITQQSAKVFSTALSPLSKVKPVYAWKTDARFPRLNQTLNSWAVKAVKVLVHLQMEQRRDDWTGKPSTAKRPQWVLWVPLFITQFIQSPNLCLVSRHSWNSNTHTGQLHGWQISSFLCVFFFLRCQFPLP